MNSQLSYFARLNLKPGEVQPINAQGSNFWIVFAPCSIALKYPGGEFGAYEQGTGLDNLPDGGTFARLEIRNPSLSTITVIVYIGGPLYRDSRLSVLEARTRLAAWPQTQLAGNTAAAFDGLAPADGGDVTYIDVKRQSLVICNLDPASPLLVRNKAHTPCAAVLPQTEQILPVSEYLEIFNATANPIACYITEIWAVAVLV